MFVRFPYEAAIKLTRMHSSRMRTTCFSGFLSCTHTPPTCVPPGMHPSPWHACPLPLTPPATNVPYHACPLACTLPLACMPPATHTPCHKCPLPCVPPGMHPSPWHACPLPLTPPATNVPYHACPLPLMPPLWTDRHLWKHYLAPNLVCGQ